jgi:hypothetical protein
VCVCVCVVYVCVCVCVCVRVCVLTKQVTQGVRQLARGQTRLTERKEEFSVIFITTRYRKHKILNFGREEIW